MRMPGHSLQFRTRVHRLPRLRSNLHPFLFFGGKLSFPAASSISQQPSFLLGMGWIFGYEFLAANLGRLHASQDLKVPDGWFARPPHRQDFGQEH